MAATVPRSPVSAPATVATPLTSPEKSPSMLPPPRAITVDSNTTWGWITQSGGDAGGDAKKLELRGADLVLGRSAAVRAVPALGDRRISTRHVRFYRDGSSRPFVEDLSTNGVLLNGRLLGKGVCAPLQDGDIVALLPDLVGNHPLRFVVNLPVPARAPSMVHAAASLLSEARTQSLDPDGDGTSPAPSGGAGIVSPASALALTPSSSDAKRRRRSGSSGGSSLEIRRSASSAKRSRSHQTHIGTDTAAPEKKGTGGDARIEEHLMCGICQELMHRSVALVPCIHSFCSACCSDWLKRSSTCPACRRRVKSVATNHAVQALVDSFLEAHPDRGRSAAELKELDTHNALTEETMKSPRLLLRMQPASASLSLPVESDHSSDDDDDGSHSGSDSYDRSYDSEEDDDGSSPLVQFRVQCPECMSAGADGWRCGADAQHVSCSMCHRPVPVRNPPARPVSCELCRAVFCDLYWTNGCAMAAGRGALKPLREASIGPDPLAVPPSAFANNAEEAAVLRAYLVATNRDLSAVLHELTDDLDANRTSFVSPVTGVQARGTTVCCARCARAVLERCLYYYRVNRVPANALPAEVRARPDCHWGRNCRTASHNAAHAQRYNHICEQTRF